MKVVVLGLGLSGKAAAHFLRRQGHELLCVDRTESAADEFSVTLESEVIDLKGVSLMVKSPGIPLTHPWVVAAFKKNITVIGEIDLAFAELQKRKKKILAITGSNGKTTTTLMAEHFLKCSGIKALATGNVGVPLIDQIDSEAEVFVVELSSFQLEHIVENKVLDGAVILNLTPNHLDRHSSFTHYIDAKLRIRCCLKAEAPLYVSRQASPLCSASHEIFDSLQEKVETIYSLSYRDRIYPHDVQNATAAYALTRVPDDFLKKGLETFVWPSHRLEHVRTHLGVNYINDSKATSVDAVIKAVQAIPTPILLIAGGVDKGGSFSEWISHFKGKVMGVFALGAAADRIERELAPEISVKKISSLEAGVLAASKRAAAGMTVLLSPGCSSYDQFKDYQHRGDLFRQIVKEKL